MYENHFGLSDKPFSLSPDPRYLFMTRRHSQAFAMLQYGVQEQLGFAVITGEVGAGKTTLLRHLMYEFNETQNVALISHTHKGLTSVLPTVLSAFGVGWDDHPNQTESQYRLFEDFLVSQFAKNRSSILIIDEAQNLTIESLEQLRLLSNINSDGNFLLQTILVGQPELRVKLARPELRQLAQRISVEFFLPTLKRKEALDYIGHRISVAGGAETLFTYEAKVLTVIATDCVPRVINSLCDLALAYAFGDGKTQVDKSIVLSVIRDKQESGILPIKSLPQIRQEIALKRKIQKSSPSSVIVSNETV